VIAALTALLIVAVLSGVGFALARHGQPAAVPPDDEVTKVDRPTLNPENRGLVAVMYHLAADLARTPDALRDLAREVQLAERRAGKETTHRIAQLVDDHAAVAGQGAMDIRRTASHT
jgi:hypothetical protein